MRLCLAEDLAAADLEPLTLTRPVYDLWLGCSSLGEKIARAFGIGPGPNRRGALIRNHLAEVQRRREPHVVFNDRDWLARGPLVVAKGRWVPPENFEPPGGGPWIGLCDGRPACAWVGPDDLLDLESNNVDAWFDRVLARYSGDEIGGEWIDRPWDLVAANARHLERDFARDRRPAVTNRQLATLALVGPSDRLRLHESARIDPYTVFDVTNGPIVVGPGVWVQPFTRVEGPCYIGPDSQLFRANIRGAVSIGPSCRIGGEVESTIIQGFSNKYHEGFLGHAYVGEWVNLGAITSNSDLRNDYGEVMVPLQGDPIPTGQAKVGCFIGDHTRTGMGSMLNTGTSIGVMCNVLPAGLLLPKHVPSFTAVMYGRVAPGFALDDVFATARIVASRRGRTFDDADERLYRTLFEQTRLERERAFQRSNQPLRDSWPVLQSHSG
ncbi:putative sugar nucleotidyl transferase [Planctomyces sp. SH-PL62]|uniref:putative sugar nucleotidyl transferase n=1 Tax=Planctomyces sp. SH-PL62 TaxID=1636152 RepID=UPI00078D8544|nr:putative sugar nucleotidyl transferase [Planctomyces sp. SH-PL62]AMV37972.1 Bacterial transferase hexapeptide (six repeats) [Planctomyces sp. SH-PL62]